VVHALNVFSGGGLFSKVYRANLRQDCFCVLNTAIPLSSRGLGGNHNSMLGDTTLHKLCMGKVGLCACGHLWTPCTAESTYVFGHFKPFTQFLGV